MQSSRVLQVALIMLVVGVGFSLVLSNASQVYAYPYDWWGSGWGCSSWGYSYSWYCPYYSGYYYPYSYGWYSSYSYPYYGSYSYSYPYSYGYSYYSQPTQYQLTVNVNPTSLQTSVTGTGSYNLGSSASFSANQNIIQVSQDTRYVFSHWTGDYSGQALSGTITMDAAKTVTAVYQLQYSLTVNTPANVPSIQGDGWYNAGGSTTITIPALIVGATNSSRLVFTGWSVDGSDGPTSTSLMVQMNAPHAINAQFKQQYYLTVTSDQGATSGTGWYDAGTQAQISASTPPSPAYGINMVFNGWNGPVASQSNQSTTVLMDGPKTVTATWRSDATVLYATVAAVIAVIAAATYLLVTRRKGTTTSPTKTSSNVQEPRKEA